MAEERTSILIVEDDNSYRRALAKTFHKAGYAVTVAPDGQKALQLLETESFQLVLTDLKMPGKDGLDLLRVLRSRSPRPKVIVMTAYGTRDSYLEAKVLEVSRFLLKPLARDYLLRAVKETLDQRDGPPDRGAGGLAVEGRGLRWLARGLRRDGCRDAETASGGE